MKELGGVRLAGKPAAPVSAQDRDLDLTWDLAARHLLLAWPLRDTSPGERAALLVAAQWLTMQFYGDAKLKPLTGMVLADANLSTPEGNFFCVSASLRPGAAWADVQQQVRSHLRRLTADAGELGQAPLLGRQLAFSLTQAPDLRAALAQFPRGTSPAMVEGNIGLQAGLNVHRYGAEREGLARMLSEISPAKVRQAAARLLAEAKGSVTAICPARE